LKRVYAIKITSDDLIIFSKKRDWDIVLSQPLFICTEDFVFFNAKILISGRIKVVIENKKNIYLE